jgi:hypothetical protein
VPLYPLAFPAAFLLNFWSGTNADPLDVVRPLLIALAIGAIVCVLATAIAGRTRAGLAASAILVGLLAPPTSPAGPALIVVAIIVLVDGVVHRGRPYRFAGVIDRVMRALAAILLLAVAIRIVTGGALARGIADVQLDFQPRGAVTAAGNPPDVVMVLVDGFPGDAAAQLAAEAGSPYDPDAFPDALTDLGFKVQRESHSNYLLTPMTLGSIFDMRHLLEVPELIEAGADAAGGRGFRRLADAGRALDILHEAGYELVWVDGGYSHIEIRRVDRWVDLGMPTEFEVRVLGSTFAGQGMASIAPNVLSDMHRQRVLTTIGEIGRLVDEPHAKPRFIFVHVPAPHAPWVFDANGAPRTESMETFYMDPVGPRRFDRAEAIRRVFAQATFVSGRVAEALRPVVDRADPPVVILFSDHGPGTEIDFSEPATTDLVERSSNFFATFTPGQPDLFDRFTTPVNIFPTLFRGYLGMDLPRSADTIYAWSGPETNLFPVAVPGTRTR